MPTVLVLDDMADGANLIRRILAPNGYDVVAFTDETEALKHARDHRLDLAILDIRLKRMNGVEVLARLKKKQPAMRAIMLTGYPSEETRHLAKVHGADAYCLKPIDTHDLERVVASVMAGRK